MAGIDSTWGSTHLQRNEIFSAQLKEMLQDDLIAQQYVRWLSDIPSDSIRTELKINSIGELDVDDWAESVSLPDRRMDTGQFTFRINEFKGVKVPFTDHFFETSFQAGEVLSRTPVKMKEAMDRYLEGKIMELGNAQTLDDANVINSAKHRFVGAGDGTSLPTNQLTPEDFAYAKYALKKANVPMTGMVAVVSPESEFYLSTLSNLTDMSYNPRWEGIVETGLLDTTGIRFIRNIYGFDVYVSEYLAENEADEANLTTYDGTAVTSTEGYTTNMFFSIADDMVKPFVGAWGRTPRIVSWRDEDIETEYHQLTGSFGLGMYRPESLVSILTPNTIGS